MTGTPEQRGPSSPAMQIDDQAAEWFDKRHFWSWNDADEEQLNAWLAMSPAHEIAYWRLEAGWERGERMAALAPTFREEPKRAAKRPPLRLFAAVAGGLFIVGLAGFFLIGANFGSAPLREKIYSTAVGAHRTVALQDGSRVELNTDTVLRIGLDAGQRHATLEKGEAYFEIKHDPVRPFVVIAAGRRVTDLGTKFLLRLDNGDRLVMALTEGSARLDATTSNSVRRSALLRPGDIAIATTSSLSLRTASARDMNHIQGWRSGVLIFDRTTIADAVAEFNRYNGEKLVVTNSVAARRTVTGTFQANNTGDFTSLTRAVLGLHVQRRGNEIVISR